MESSSNEPTYTKESIQASIDESKRQIARYEGDIEYAKNTPLSHTFTEIQRESAIRNYEQSIRDANASIAESEEKLANLDS